MANVSFMAHGIKLWAEYKDHGDHDVELLTIMTDKSDVDIEPLLGSDIIELAYSAIDIDIAEIAEYKKECMHELRCYEGWSIVRYRQDCFNSL